MRFKIWVENGFEDANITPASSEVIKTGLQPQVDSKEINTQQKEENDKMLAIDSHIQRLASILPSIKSGDRSSEKLKMFSKFLNSVIEEWDKIKSNSDGSNTMMSDPWGFNPSRIDWMKENQPLPEEPRSSAHPTAF